MKAALAFVLLAATVMAQSQQPGRTAIIYGAYEDQLIRRIDQHFHDGEYVECISILRLLQGIHPHDAEIASQIVWMLGNVNQESDALLEAMKFRKAHASDATAVQTEALWYSNKKLWSRIPPLLEPTIASNPDIRNFVLLARAYEEMGLLKEAVRIWEVRVSKIGDPRGVAAANLKRLQALLGGG